MPRHSFLPLASLPTSSPTDPPPLQRITFHPSHFVKLAAPDATLVANSIRELEAHSEVRRAGNRGGTAGSIA